MKQSSPSAIELLVIQGLCDKILIHLQVGMEPANNSTQAISDVLIFHVIQLPLPSRDSLFISTSVTPIPFTPSFSATTHWWKSQLMTVRRCREIIRHSGTKHAGWENKHSMIPPFTQKQNKFLDSTGAHVKYIFAMYPIMPPRTATSTHTSRFPDSIDPIKATCAPSMQLKTDASIQPRSALCHHVTRKHRKQTVLRSHVIEGQPYQANNCRYC